MVFRSPPAGEFVQPRSGTGPVPAAHAAAFPLLDWLRFALASVVVLGHSGLIPWADAGYLAVQVFLALSGWLIGGILLETERDGLPRFFYNRGTRIWIPYAIAVALLYGVSALRDPVNGLWLHHLAYDVTFTHNLYSLKPDPATAIPLMPLQGTGNHFWSIGVEEQFYLLAPLVMLFTPWGKSLRLWVPMAIVMVASASWFGAIGLGVAAAIARRDLGDWHLPYRPLFAVAAAAALALILTPGTPMRQIAPVFAIAVVLFLAVPGERGRAGLLFGGLSYPLYLNHWIPVFAVHFLLSRLGMGSNGLWEMVAYGLSVAGAAVHFWLIDRNIQRWRGAFYTVGRGQALRFLAYGLFLGGLALGLATWGLPFWG